MNKKRIIIIICLFLGFMSAMSFACAVEDVESPPISTSVVDDSPSLQASDTQNDILTESPDSFTQLDSLVQSNDSVKLDKNYTYSDSDVAFKNGININKLESYLINGEFVAAQFYVEAECHPDSQSFKNAFEELSFYSDGDIKILGTYKKFI